MIRRPYEKKRAIDKDNLRIPYITPSPNHTPPPTPTLTILQFHPWKSEPAPGPDGPHSEILRANLSSHESHKIPHRRQIPHKRQNHLTSKLGAGSSPLTDRNSGQRGRESQQVSSASGHQCSDRPRAIRTGRRPRAISQFRDRDGKPSRRMKGVTSWTK